MSTGKQAEGVRHRSSRLGIGLDRRLSAKTTAAVEAFGEPIRELCITLVAVSHAAA